MLVLISHHLCPYVQRAAIALAEKEVPFERIDIDLANKPDWFLAISPLGKTPVLQVGDRAIFESAVILEYIEETQPRPLHPADPLARAEHRSWIEFGSAVLADIAGLYSAPDAAAFDEKRQRLAVRFARLEARVAAAPWFDGEPFSLVDVVFAPVFRYFDVLDAIIGPDTFAGLPKVAAWRGALAERDSVRTGVSPDYPDRLRRFLTSRDSHLARLMASVTAPARAA